ncbi:hypothetical protein U9M48_017530 [Paspalum notatum var. saurae]|uniref:RCC1-like domain-containing protein n=1 Tax=Paspalum notatum var. saurae TaxID=547442 RepID=A0AAQ3T7M1_PASNO
MEKLAVAAAPRGGRGAEEDDEAAEWAWSWGAGTDGQLGNGGFDDHYLPQPLLLPTRCRGRVSLVAGGGAHAIALTNDGEVFSWGRGTHGQLGHGNLENIPQPKLVKFLENHTITYVSAGWNHSGFSTDSDQLFMCGDGSFGQLGTGDNHSRNLPFEVAYFNGRHIEKLAFGMRHSLILLKDNSVYGFGSARRGQVGKLVSRNQKSYNVPRLIDGFPNCKIVNIYANGDHSAALDESGHLYIWGRALIGEQDDDQPREALSSLCISQVALGWHHALVLSGELYTLGVYRHQKCDLHGLGNAAGKPSNTSATSSSHDHPSSLSTLEKVPCINGERVVQIASGTEHSALVTDKGSVFTWGWGEHGQLGLGDTLDHVSPQRVDIRDKGPGSLGVYCGSGFTVAVKLA